MSLMLILAEEIGCVLPSCIDTDLDATPPLLPAGLLTPKVLFSVSLLCHS